MKIQKDRWGGILLTIPAPFALPEDLRNDFLEKWEGANEDGEVDDLLAEAERIAAPKAYVLPAFVAERDDRGVRLTVPFEHTEVEPVRAVRMDSPLLAEKLEQDTRVVAMLATCGKELHALSMTQAGDPLLRGVAEDICLLYMRIISGKLREYVRDEIIGNAKFSALNPGSLPTWPITAQAELFSLLGEGADLCGVELTPSSLMIPFKSSSGLLFPTEIRFESCMRCPRLTCPGRRAPYEGT